jgi:hypothetical protein
MYIKLNPDTIRRSQDRGLTISIPKVTGCSAMSEDDPCQLYLEMTDEGLMLYVWNDSEDPTEKILFPYNKKPVNKALT